MPKFGIDIKIDSAWLHFHHKECSVSSFIT